MPDIQRAAPDFCRFRARSLRLALEPDLLAGPTDYTAIKQDIAELEDKVRQIKKGEREEDLPDLAYYTNRLARIYYDFGKFMAAVDAWQTLLSISKNLNDKEWEAIAVGNLGLVYRNLGEYDKARGYHEQALEIHREFGNRQGEASQLGGLGAVYHDLGKYNKALRYHEQALEIAKELGNRSLEATIVNNLKLLESKSGPGNITGTIHEDYAE